VFYFFQAIKMLLFMADIAGREAEKIILEKIEQSGEAELVAVYGRRRVG